MKASRKLGKRAFHLQFGLIIVFVLTLIVSYVKKFDINIEAWNTILLASSALLTTVWGGIATKNFLKKNDIQRTVVDEHENVNEGGN